MVLAVAAVAAEGGRLAKGVGRGGHVSGAHWSAAMADAGRDEAAAGAPIRAAAARTPVPRVTAIADGSGDANAGTHAPRTAPHEAGTKPAAHIAAAVTAAITARAAHGKHAANPEGFFSLIFAPAQTFHAEPPEAAAPAGQRSEHAAPRAAAHRLAPNEAEPAAPHDAAAPGDAAPGDAAPGDAAPGDAAPSQSAPPAAGPAAASAGGIPARAQNLEAVAGPAGPINAPPVPAPAPAPTEAANAAALSNGDSGPSARPAAKLAADDGKAAAFVSAAGPTRLAAGPHNALPPPAQTAAPSPSLSPAPAALPALPALPASSGPAASGQTAPAAGEAAAPSAFPPALPAATPSPLAAAVLAMQKAGGQNTVLSLDPAGLGAMTVHVSIGQTSQVNVQFAPSLPQTAQLLTSHLDDLRQAMTAAGIALGQASVHADGGHAGGHGGSFSPPFRQAAPFRSNPAAPALNNTGAETNRAGGLSAYA